MENSVPSTPEIIIMIPMIAMIIVSFALGVYLLRETEKLKNGQDGE